jgi:MFS family permease
MWTRGKIPTRTMKQIFFEQEVHPYQDSYLVIMRSYTIISDSEKSAVHPNVNKMLVFCGLYGLASAIAIMGIFDTYLYMQSSDSNSAVGLAESVSGITQVLIVLPAGYLADRYSRSGILRWCMVLSVLYVTIAIIGIYNDSIFFIYASLILGGIYTAVQNSTSFALFSDSIPQGDRAKWMSKVAVITQVAMGMGPLLGLFLFKYFGDVWEISVLHTILIIGFLLMIPANMFLTNWADIPKGMYSPAATTAPLLEASPHIVTVLPLI